LQLDPSELVASAPGGTESTWIDTFFGAGLKESIDSEEQPAKPKLATATTIILRIIHPFSCGTQPQTPREQ
jgi:hypothetical protein